MVNVKSPRQLGSQPVEVEISIVELSVGVTELGVKVDVAPDGSPETLKETGVVVPESNVAVTE